jgi:hypothetical protein
MVAEQQLTATTSRWPKGLGVMALRTTVVAASAVVTAVVFGVVSMFTTAFTFVAVASTTVLIMGGTGHPLATPPDTLQYVEDFTSAAVNNFVSPSSTASTGIPGGPYNAVGVITPEEDGSGNLTVLESIAQGLASLDSCITSTTCDYNDGIGSTAPATSDSFVVFGYSQSAAIAMLEKAKLAAEYAMGAGPDVTFVVIGNARPNGGLVARDTEGIFTSLVLGIPRDELVTAPAPTGTQYATVDIALQYDLFADAPLNPLNLLAVVNAYMGMLLLHPNYTDYSLTDPGVIDQGQYDDTHYYLIPAKVLPLLMPLDSVPVIGHVLADTLDPALRVIIESAYDRTVSPGVPTAWNPRYFGDPVTFTRNLLEAIPTGLDNGIQDIFGVRLFGTVRPGPYGIGSEVPETTSDTPDSSAQSSSAAAAATGAKPTSAKAGAAPRLAHPRRATPVAAATRSGNSRNSDESSASRKPSAAHRGAGSSKRAS